MRSSKPSKAEPITVIPECDHGGATVVLEPTCVFISFHVDGGHLPPATRQQLVDSVFELSEVRSGRMVHASVPMGDVELLDALRHHCSSMTTHAAGSTCLVEGILT
jgi:hypothetical protein